jgi:tetratricopeptide (TPR) repeat protein
VTLALVVPISLALSEKNLGALLSSVSEMSRETTDLSRSDYLLTQFTVIVKYIGLILLPVNQSLEHNEFIYDSFFDIKVLSSFILIATIIASGIFIHILSSVQKTWKSSYLKALAFPESRFISFGIFWFFLALSVESSIIPIRDLIFEHRVYLPFTGAALMFSGVYSLAQRHVHSRYMSLVPMAIIIVLAFTTWHRNAVWREPMTLWKDAAEKGDLKDRPFLELGIVYLTRNDLNRALEYAHRAVELNPIHYGNWLVLGEIQIEAGQTENALSSFKEAIRLKPEGIKGRNTLAILNLRLGKLAEARQVLEEALAIAPDDPLLNSNMALVLGQQGEINAAIIHAQTAIRLKPDFAEAYKNLGTAYLIQGDVEHAKNSLEEALRYDPSLADAHNNLGMLLLQKRDMEKALYHFKRATDLKPDNVSFRNNLAAVEKYKK